MLRRVDERIRRDRLPGDFGNLFLVDVIEAFPVFRIVDVKVGNRIAARRVVRQNRFHITVEMLDLLSGFEGSLNADETGVGVTDDADVLFGGFVDGGFVNFRLDKSRDFDEIVTRRFRFSDGFARFVRRIDDKIVSLLFSRQMRACRINLGRDDFASG